MCQEEVKGGCVDYNPSLENTLFYRVMLEPTSFIMERKMLLGIKQRAESAAAEAMSIEATLR